MRHLALRQQFAPERHCTERTVATVGASYFLEDGKYPKMIFFSL